MASYCDFSCAGICLCLLLGGGNALRPTLLFRVAAQPGDHLRRRDSFYGRLAWAENHPPVLAQTAYGRVAIHIAAGECKHLLAGTVEDDGKLVRHIEGADATA